MDPLEPQIEMQLTNPLAAALDEATAEAINDKAPIAVAWIKRRGKTRAEDGYAVVSGATFMQLLKEAGY